MTGMAVLGRILQVIGWLWVIAGVVGPALNLPSVSFFPGIIIVFASRILRTQAARSAPQPDLDSDAPPLEPFPRPLNTERPRPAEPPAQPRPGPTAQTRPPAKQAPKVTWPKDEPKPGPEREESLEKILLAAGELADEVDEAVSDMVEPDTSSSPMTSAEMIARAKQRWDRKP